MRLSVSFHPQTLSVSVDPASVQTGFGAPIARTAVERDPYEGDYAITPGAEAVLLSTKDKRMTDDVVINPIPSNYGLITWNGSTLTVS